MKYAPLVAAFGALVMAVPALSAQETYQRHVPDDLAKRAKITEHAAAGIARRHVPHGQIQSLELENEKGSLIYSFLLKVPGRAGVEEVNVSARSGKVLAMEHERAEVKKP